MFQIYLGADSASFTIYGIIKRILSCSDSHSAQNPQKRPCPWLSLCDGGDRQVWPVRGICIDVSSTFLAAPDAVPPDESSSKSSPNRVCCVPDHRLRLDLVHQLLISPAPDHHLHKMRKKDFLPPGGKPPNLCGGHTPPITHTRRVSLLSEANIH